MYDQAKLKSLQELRAMLDQESLGRLKKPAAEVPAEVPAAASEEVAAAPVEQEDPAQLQALLEAYDKEDDALPPA